VSHSAAKTSITAGGITVELSHTDKMFFPDDKITKGDLIEYYASVADRMLPYLKDRPVTMARYPDGITGHRIFQKNVPGYFPDWITRAPVKKEGGELHQVICDKPATLIYLANQACVEPHVFLSRIDRLDHPDQLVIDFDPPDGQHFEQARRGALWLKELLTDDLGATPFVKTTGGRGLHVHIPLDRAADFDEGREFALALSAVLADRHPDDLTTEQRKQGRDGRVYLDAMRNSYAQLVVAPYAVRARPGAAVATPLHWAEVDDPALDPAAFNLRTTAARLDSTDDPWTGLNRHRYSLAKLAERLGQMKAG
jgi:bifunctional non-homologous end joining protein LigD